MMADYAAYLTYQPSGQLGDNRQFSHPRTPNPRRPRYHPSAVVGYRNDANHSRAPRSRFPQRSPITFSPASMSPSGSSGAVGGPFRHRLHEGLHQHDIDQGGFIDNQQVTIERVVVAPLEAAALWVHLQQPMDGLGLEAGRLGHALRSAAGRRAQEK